MRADLEIGFDRPFATRAAFRPFDVADDEGDIFSGRHAGLDEEARAAWNASDWTTVQELYEKAKGFDGREAAA